LRDNAPNILLILGIISVLCRTLSRFVEMILLIWSAMMNDQERYPSYVECVASALKESAHPLSMGELVVKVEERRPVDRGGRNAIYRAVERLFQVVPVAPGRYGWLSSCMNDSVFRHPLTRDEVRRGYLMLDELEHAVFSPDFFQGQRANRTGLTVSLLGGPTLDAYTYIEKKTWSLFLGPDFVQWVDEQGGRGFDAIVITVEDAASGRYHLRLQPREARDDQLIQGRNIQLALDAEEIVTLERRVRSVVPSWELAARLIGRGFYKDSTPPDDLHFTLNQYSLLNFVGDIGYSLEIPPGVASVEPPAIRNRRVGAGTGDDIRELMNQVDADIESGAEWADLFAPDAGGDFPGESADTCGAYEFYLEQFEDAGERGQPLAHQNFHLLEAELEYLLALQMEFGVLLPEQERRQDELAARLFIDPDSWPNDDYDIPDSPDYGDPPYWEN